MKELLFKSLIGILTLILIINVFTAISYATSDTNNFDLSKYGNDATTSSSSGLDASAITDPTTTIAGIIVSAVRIVGTGIALIMMTVLAIRYISSAPGERAEIKKSAVQYVVGAVILFASSQILGILVDAFSKMISSK